MNLGGASVPASPRRMRREVGRSQVAAFVPGHDGRGAAALSQTHVPLVVLGLSSRRADPLRLGIPVPSGPPASRDTAALHQQLHEDGVNKVTLRASAAAVLARCKSMDAPRIRRRLPIHQLAPERLLPDHPKDRAVCKHRAGSCQKGCVCFRWDMRQNLLDEF